MTHKQPPRPRITVETKRKCANPTCANRIDKVSRYTTCCYRCKLAVDAELAAIEAADKAEEAHPF